MTSPRAHKRLEGLSLVEVMIVTVIVAIAMTGVTMSLRAVTEASLRSASVKIAAACRYAYQRAIIKSRTVRVVFDFNNNTIAIEEAHGQIVIGRGDGEDEVSERDSAGSDPWQEARALVESGETFEVAEGASPWGPLQDDEGNTLERYQAQELADGVQMLRIITPHEPEPRTEGIGAVYFFPQGYSENAFVQITDGDDDVFTVHVHPLTGRGRIYDLEVDPENLPEGASLTVEDPE